MKLNQYKTIEFMSSLDKQFENYYLDFKKSEGLMLQIHTLFPYRKHKEVRFKLKDLITQYRELNPQ